MKINLFNEINRISLVNVAGFGPSVSFVDLFQRLQAGTSIAFVSRIDYDTYNGQKQLINAYVR